MSFLLVCLASAIGSAVGVTVIFLIMGLLSRRLEREREKEIRKQQEAFLEMRQKEVERMQRYAEMEG
jgi:uncharacterized membrane-anchored protein YhcB (DUF1043 family)